MSVKEMGNDVQKPLGDHFHHCVYVANQFTTAFRVHVLILAAIFLFSCAIYSSAAANWVTFSDSGDFLMGISELGNVHGPGYPLYIILAKLFSKFFPFGSFEFRIALFSGLFAAATSCLIYWVIFQITRKRTAGAVAGLCYGFSYSFFYQSTIAETYSLNAFLIVLLIILALRWEKEASANNDSKAENALCLTGLVFGLALSNHFSVIMLTPAFLFFYLCSNAGRTLNLRTLFKMFLFILIGMLPYLYQPVAAFRGPYYNFGDPSTLKSWYLHVTAFYQRGGMWEYPLTYLPGKLWRFVTSLQTEYPFFWWLIPIGLIPVRNKRQVKFSIFVFLLMLLSLIAPMLYAQEEAVLRAHFYYEAYLFAAILLGFGTARLLAIFNKISITIDRNTAFRQVCLATITTSCLLVPLTSIVAHYKWVDKSNYDYADNMARLMLKEAEPDSIILANNDNVVFPLRYIQQSKKLRPDIRIIRPDSIGVGGFSGIDLLRYSPTVYAHEDNENLTNSLIKRNIERFKIYSTDATTFYDDFEYNYLGYIVRVDIEGTGSIEQAEESVFLQSNSTFLDNDAKEAILLPQALKAIVAYSKHNYAEANNIYERITQQFTNNTYVPTLYSCDTYKRLFSLWGILINMSEEYDLTISNLNRANSFAPDYTSLARAQAFEQTELIENAKRELIKFLRFNPDNILGSNQLVKTYIGTGEFLNALKQSQVSLLHHPNNQEAHLYCAIALYHLDDKLKAKLQLIGTIAIDPDTELSKTARFYLDKLLNNY